MKILEHIANGKKVSIKKMLHERLAETEPGRSIKNIHASDLFKDREWCPREIALMLKHDIEPASQFIGTSQRVTFDYGRFVESTMATKWLADVAIGNWKCSTCGAYNQLTKKPIKKDCSGKCSWTFVEPRFLSAVSGISCGTDLLVDVGQQKWRVLECKTIKAEDFKELKAPLEEHRLRTQLYLRIIDEMGEPYRTMINTQEAHIIYVCKGFGNKDQEVMTYGIKDAPFSPFKEFVIKRDDSANQVQVGKAKTLNEYNKTGKMPCGICSNAFNDRAKSCKALKHCFSGESPGELTWEVNGSPAHTLKVVVK